MFLNLKTAQNLVDRIMENLGYNINIMDENGCIIASGQETRIGKVHTGAKLVLKNASTINYFNVTNTQLQSSQPGINMPLYHDGIMVGVVGVTGDPNELADVAIMVKMAAELLLEQELANNKRHNAQMTKNMYFHRILSATYIDDDQDIRLWGEKHKYSFDILRIVCVFTITTKENTHKLREWLIQKVESSNYFLNEDIISYLGNNHTVILKSLHATKEPHQKEELCAFFHAIQKDAKEKEIIVKFYCGGCVAKLSDLKSSYSQARFLCNWPVCKEKTIHLIGDYLLEYLVSQSDQIYLQTLFKTELFDLSKMDDLAQTIIAMCSNNMNLDQAAKSLFLHRNTLSFRMQKIKDLLCLDPLHCEIDRKRFHLLSAILQHKKVI